MRGALASVKIKLLKAETAVLKSKIVVVLKISNSNTKLQPQSFIQVKSARLVLDLHCDCYGYLPVLLSGFRAQPVPQIMQVIG